MRFSVIAPPRVMARDARAMRGDGPFVFAQAIRGVGLEVIEAAIVAALKSARA